MESSQLLSILHKLNTYPNGSYYTKYKLSSNVDYAHIWDDDEDNYRPKTYFLFKEADKYVGIVLDMCIDLHWVVHPDYRRKGYLRNALHSAILPFFFQIGKRDEIRITIDEDRLNVEDYNSSISVAQKVGFESIGGNQLILKAENFDSNLSELNITYSGMGIDEVSEIKQQLTSLAKQINYINSKVEMSFGKPTDNYMMSLELISNKVNNYKFGIDDIRNDYESEN